MKSANLVRQQIEDFWAEFRTAPSVRELVDRTGLSSTSVVYSRLGWLVEQGEIEAVGEVGTTRRYVPVIDRCRDLLRAGRGGLMD